MNPNDSANKASSATRTNEGGPTVGDGIKYVPDVNSSSQEARIERAETRTYQAEERMEQAEIRSGQAEERSESAIRASELRYRRLF